MMNDRLRKSLVALASIAALGACEEATVDTGDTDAARLTTNPSFVIVEAGDSTLVSAFLVNNLGNPVQGDVTFSACDATITAAADETQSPLEPGTNFYISGNTLGESCVNVSGAGFDQTIGVRVVAAGFATTAVTDTVRAGDTGSIDVTLINAAGGAVGPFAETDATFTSDNEDALFFTDDAGSFDTHESDAVERHGHVRVVRRDAHDRRRDQRDPGSAVRGRVHRQPGRDAHG